MGNDEECGSECVDIYSWKYAQCLGIQIKPTYKMMQFIYGRDFFVAVSLH